MTPLEKFYGRHVRCLEVEPTSTTRGGGRGPLTSVWPKGRSSEGAIRRKTYRAWKQSFVVGECMLLAWMKSNLSTKALLESKLGSRVEESLPKKKKKRKERRRNKRNKKSSEGCQIKRRKAKKMFPWMFMPGIESGRSRRRRESSSDSRRRRRDRRRRDRTRSRERSRGRSPRSRRSEASSHLPVAEPGYRWCQIPETVLHGGTGPAVAQAPLPPPPAPPVQQWPQQPPAHGSRSLGSHSRKPGASRLGASVAVAVPANGTRAGASKGRRAGTNGLRRTKAVTGPNQTPRTSLWREFLPQRQLPPRKILTKWRWPQRKRLMWLQLGRLSARRRASTPIYGRRPHSRLWLIPIGLCVSGSWSRMAA